MICFSAKLYEKYWKRIKGGNCARNTKYAVHRAFRFTFLEKVQRNQIDDDGGAQRIQRSRQGRRQPQDEKFPLPTVPTVQP
jgi:hypothetical protein